VNESFIKDIGRSYIVSSLLPAAFFTMLAVVVFRRFIPIFILDNLNTGKETTIFGAGALLLMLIFWVAFALYSGVDFIVRVYEGYYLLPFIAAPFKYIHYKLQKCRLKEYAKYKALEKEIKNVEGEDRVRLKLEYAQLRPLVQSKMQKAELYAPLLIKKENWRLFMPTRLGNILRASEMYPQTRYQIDGIALFPRLSAVFPSEFAAEFEEKNNHLLFLLNSSLLSCTIGLASVVLGLIGQFFPHLASAEFVAPPNMLQRGFSLLSPTEHILIGLGFLVASYVIYCASITVAEGYAFFVRTAFDLYRFSLLRALNHPVPTSLAEEQGTWAAISEFLIAGERLGRIAFTYKLKPEYAAGLETSKAKSERSSRTPPKKNDSNY
jgi:hypothetical protein